METRQKKKILYVITKSNWGGAQRYVYDLATSLLNKDFDVMVAAGGEGELKSKLTQAGIEVYNLPIQNDLSIGNALASLRVLLGLLKTYRPDILHINSSKAGIIAGIAGRLAWSKSIIFTSHGWAFLEDRPFAARLLIRIAQWLTILLSHKVIAVSEHIKQSAPSLFFTKDKITVIKHGIAPFFILSRESAQETLLGEKAHQFKDAAWVGTISELHPNKGLRYAIRAVKELENAVFIIIGEGVERERLEQEILKLKLGERVFLVGHKDNARELLGAFDIFSLTSTTEALGYVLLEAGQAGLAVVASRVGGIPEIIEDGKTGLLIEPRDVKGIGKALSTLIHDREMREKLGTALKKKVEQEFPLEQMVEKTLRLYQKAG